MLKNIQQHNLKKLQSRVIIPALISGALPQNQVAYRKNVENIKPALTGPLISFTELQYLISNARKNNRSDTLDCVIGDPSTTFAQKYQ